ncbi:MAG TPA: hypothetical protein DIW31_03200 [Bacteroidales bacterium]|nr:hypothetical protein [Bacteroidales bacterium]
MNPEILIPIGVGIVIITIILVSLYFNKHAVIKRKLKKAVGKKISTFISGDIAKVVGKVEFAGEPLIAPLSGRRCAQYHVLVEEQVSSGKSSHWKTIIEEEVVGKFVIRDGRHCAHINNQKVKSYLVEDRKYSSRHGHDATPELERFLNAHGQKSEGFFGWNKNIRYKEGVLEEGELIAAVGRGEWKTAEQAQLPDTYDRVLEISATEQEPVYLSDDPETVKTTYSDMTI